MTSQAFAAAALGWHDFFLAVAGASAALLGLLFVGVSINLSAIAADARVDLRVRAGQAFANLLSVLVIALLLLIPDPDPQPTAIGLAVVAGLGLLRVVRNFYSVFRAPKASRKSLTAVRRLVWTVVADLALIFTAWRIWSLADATVIQNLVTVVFLLLIGAAVVAWSMLVEISRERTS